MAEKRSPIYMQYKRLKEKYRDAILLFRLGDFYEMFFEDAYKASGVLNLTLTSKPMGKDFRVPMCGIPVKAAGTYIKKLLDAGYKVAIAEQMDQMETKRLMKREVVEVLTPGTIMDEDFLSDSKNNYIAALYGDFNKMGLALLDVSTGEFTLYEGRIDEVMDFIGRMDIRELIIPEDFTFRKRLPESAVIVEIPHVEFDFISAGESIKDFFGKGVEAFVGLKTPVAAVRAAGALLKYVRQNKGNLVNHIKGMKFSRLGRYMGLDSQTIRNLELVENIRGDSAGITLLKVLDRCKTPVGKRSLRRAILNPFRELEPIEERLNRIETLMELDRKLKRVRELLSGMGDPERKMGKLSMGRITPVEMRDMALSLRRWLDIHREIGELKPFEKFFDNVEALDEISSRILNTLSDEPPYNLSDGNVIRKGIDPQLDRFRGFLQESQFRLRELEESEREKTGIPTLRIGYNSVFGYYIEITKPHRDKVPSHWEGVQTLVNTIRFKSPQLIELEREIVHARDRIYAIEKHLFDKLKAYLLQNTGHLRRFFEALGELDMVSSIATVSIEKNYVRPTFNRNGIYEIRDGRHPIVEETSEEFIPNDLHMDDSRRVIILTGPNMSGKSTYLRQNALIVLMAHMGFYVPASRANVNLTDRVFSRVGASDDISRGLSTFMAEMVETATILNNATKNSFVILDEVGRGTSTFDGMAIARAVVEYISQFIKARTLFATHYSELASLEDDLQGVSSFTMEVLEYGDDVIFTRKVIKGRSDRSYGIYVARIAGLPEWVIKRAQELLLQYEAAKDPHFILQVDPDSLTPRQALDLLYRLKEKIQKPEEGE